MGVQVLFMEIKNTTQKMTEQKPPLEIQGSLYTLSFRPGVY